MSAVKIFLSGPMRGLPNDNIEAFDDAAERLSRSYEVMNPAEISRQLWDKHGGLEKFEALSRSKQIQTYFHADLTALLNGCEMIVLLPGFEKSRGSTWELLNACHLGITAVLFKPSLAGGYMLLNYPITTERAIAMHAAAMQTALPEPPVAKKPETVLAIADKLVDGDRQSNYGHPLDNFTNIAEFINAYLRVKGILNPLNHGHDLKAEDVAMLMDLLKMAREMTRFSPDYRDNRIDGPGYWKCLDLIIAERLRRATEAGGAVLNVGADSPTATS